jgi:hypothetical protein
MVLDGWHRFTAANEVGVACPTVDLGDVDPQDFVIAKNKARRHITASQLASAVVAVYGWRSAGRNPAPGAGLDKTSQQLAEMAGVSERTIRQAKVVEAKATPEVKKAVKAGVMSVKKAAETVNPPKETKAEPEDDLEYFGPSEEEIESAHEAAAADLSTLMKIIDSDDKVAALVDENKRLRAELSVVASARDGFMNRCNELIAKVKSLTRKLTKAEASNV